MSILSEILKSQEEDYYLRNTSYLVHIAPADFRAELTGLYNHTELSSRALAVVLNAIYTDGKPTFFLSIRTLEKLFNEDKNLNYGSRKGIKTTQYREAAAELLNFLKASPSFEVIASSSKEHKTPACIALINEMTILSMGNEMAMKLRSNWHETVVKCLWNLRKCHEITEQSQKSSHDKDKDKDKVKVKQEINNENFINIISSPLEVGKSAAVEINSDITPEAILVTWKPAGNINYKELDSVMSDLFTTLKYHSFPKDELSTKKILKSMYGSNPHKDIEWLVNKTEQAIDEQRELVYSPGIQMQKGLTKRSDKMKEDVEFNRFEYIMAKAKGAKNV